MTAHPGPGPGGTAAAGANGLFLAGRLDDRRVVVTGAASGIGLALAQHAASLGARVVMCDVDENRLAEAAGRLGADAIAADVSDPRAMKRLSRKFADTQILCLNAGVASLHSGPAWAASAAEWKRVLSVNLHGIVNGLRAFVPSMLKRGEPSALLLTVSLAGLVTWREGGPYAASKHAAAAVAEQAALELADTCIGVTMLCPAFVRTGMHPWGEEPLAVAKSAFGALDKRTFCVLAPEWAPAVCHRSKALASGDPPALPVPSNSADRTDTLS